MNKLSTLSLLIIISTMLVSCSKEEPEYGYEGSRQVAARDCSSLEPSNPYSSGSGHYAGYEWAESNSVDSCDGNSNSFIEGCESYVQQTETYESCTSGD